jgi:hypothetical protein
VDAATYAGTCAPSAKPADFALTALNPRASYWVVASDYNLNFLSTGTKYSVDPVGKVNATATYTGLDKIADLLGMSYRYWPCDQSGACASQCRATGANAPCRMMPSLSGFSCGYGAGVTIDRGQSADVGTIEFDWNVVTSWQRYGSGVDFIVSRPQRGTSP